jgi:hypothetical protein
VLAAGMSAAEVLVLVDYVTPNKCCIIALALETIADLVQ